MIELQIKAGDSKRSVIGTTMNYGPFEFYMYDEVLGRRNFIQFINLECKTASDLEKQVEGYLENFEETFAGFKSTDEWFRRGETKPIGMPPGDLRSGE